MTAALDRESESRVEDAEVARAIPNRVAALPVLTDGAVTLRELTLDDVAALFTHLSSKEVSRYIAPPPSTPAGFRRFIEWMRVQQRRGSHICFGIVPPNETSVCGVIELWKIEPDFSTAEWGFAIGERYWGTGLFPRAAALLLDYAFTDLGVLRLEARAVDKNGRGNGALRKLGSTREGRLRRAFRAQGSENDQIMWSIMADEWATTRTALLQSQADVRIA